MLTIKNYIAIIVLVIIFLGSVFASFAIPIYSIYNIVNTYKLDKNYGEYEIAAITYTSRGSKGRSFFVYNFKVLNDDKIYRKNYYGYPKYDKILYVKFNENKTYWIIKDHINLEYINDGIYFVLAGVFVCLAIALFKIIRDIKKHI